MTSCPYLLLVTNLRDVDSWYDCADSMMDSNECDEFRKHHRCPAMHDEDEDSDPDGLI